MRKNQSTEDYLKAIFEIRKKTGQCRSVDVAGHLNISKASVSKAVEKLSGEGLLIKSYDGQLLFTEEGSSYAAFVTDRYELLYRIFRALGVSEQTADEDACNSEHSISRESYEKILEWYNSHMTEK